MRETLTHVYFWGSYLSNWFSCSFKDNLHTYPSSESYLMVQKALLFGDTTIALEILKTNDPKKQKALGRKVKGFNEQVWNDNKFDIMVSGLLLKFGQNEALKKQLLSTKNKTLVEGSPFDKIWGVGLHYTDPLILDESKWLGENLLGKALMEVRSKI